MDRNKCKDIRAALDNGIFAAIEKQFGVKVSIGNAKYDGGMTEFKIMFSEIASDGTVLTREATDFKQAAGLFGLKPEDLGKTFRNGGKVFKIIGLRAKAYAKPILCESGGKQYVFPAETVKAMLALDGSLKPAPTI